MSLPINSVRTAVPLSRANSSNASDTAESTTNGPHDNSPVNGQDKNQQNKQGGQGDSNDRSGGGNSDPDFIDSFARYESPWLPRPTIIDSTGLASAPPGWQDSSASVSAEMPSVNGQTEEVEDDDSGSTTSQDMSIVGHVGDGLSQFGKGVWGIVEGLGGLAVGVGKTAYDINPIGRTNDHVENLTGADLPDWLPSADRGTQRLETAAQGIKELGVAVWDDPSILVSEYKQLANEGRYGAIVGQVAADFGDLLLGTKGAGKVGKLAEVSGTVDLAGDADKLIRASESATDLAKAAASNSEFATQSRNAIEKTRAALEVVDDSPLTATARTKLDETKALLDEVLEISAPRDPNIGNPAAIARGFGELSPRQVRMLDSMPERGSSMIVHKSDVKMTDIAAFTAKTGVEFAIFTRGSQRMVVRGDEMRVPIDIKDAAEMKSDGWRWSAHTQPGLETRHTTASSGDQAVLEAFGQEHSLILNSRGEANVFSPTETRR